MTRPKSTTPPKEKLNLTVSRETKAMLNAIRTQGGMSISEWVEEIVRKETKRLQRTGAAPDLQHGQMDIDDILKGGNENT